MMREVLHLLSLTRRSRWALVLFLAFVVGAFEAVGAALVLVLLQMITDPEGGMVLPVVGDLHKYGGQLNDESLLLIVLAVFGGFFLVRAVVKILQSYVQQRVIQNAGSRLSTRLVSGYLRMPYEWHLQRNSAALIRTAHQSVNQIANQVFQPLITIGSESLLLLMLLAVLAAASPTATLMAVVITAPTAFLLVRVVQPTLKRMGAISHEAVRAYFSTLQQSLTGIQDLKAFGKGEYFTRRFSRERASFARAAYLRQALSTAPGILMEFALMVFILVFFAYTVTRGSSMQAALPMLGLFAYAGLRLKPSIQKLLSSLNTLKFSSAAIDEVSADLASTEHAPAFSPRADPLPFDESIVFDHVSFRYEGAELATLNGIDLRISKGQSLGVCGPTGGGKSTLVNLLTGFLQPTEGAIRIDGQPLDDSIERWQANLGLVSQTVFLLDDTLRHNVALGIPDTRIDDDRLWEAIRLAQLADFVESLPDGLETHVGEHGTRLSGGQRQRVAIARALYIDPPVLIFDEGTSALDNITEAELVRTLDRLSSDRTIIIVAHRLSTIRDTDNVIVVEGGRITATGQFDTLLESHPFFQSAPK
jgi:ATP-binding cassette, subfamily B, bacterial PglK